MTEKTSPKLFVYGVDHSPMPVMENFPEFSALLKGRKTLYIELPEKWINVVRRKPLDVFQAWKLFRGKKSSRLRVQVTVPYLLLASEAIRRGLNVVSLDQKKAYKTPTSHPEGMSPGELSMYQNRNGREKTWEKILSQAPAFSIAVMHPIHAEAIVRSMKLPQSSAKVVPANLKPWERENVVRINKIAERVASQRLARARKRSWERKPLPKTKHHKP